MPRPPEGASESGKAVESCGGRQTGRLTQVEEDSIGLDREDADRAGTSIEGIDEFAVSADCGVEVGAAVGICADDGRTDRCECSRVGDGVSGDVGGAGADGVNDAAVWSD